MNILLSIVLIGIGATVVMDLWGIVRKRLFGSTAPNYKMVGRWIAYMAYGKFRHNAIATSPAMCGEHLIGWTFHYLVGIAFAALLISIWGVPWLYNPTLGPALTVGIATIAAPFLLMQPGMGAGLAAARTAKPTSARLQSLVTHTVFGLGLYLSGSVVQLFYSV
ncbi:hypothetical protein tinsulaeT_06730 [Thalassotalea insulae]|uniref:DUF2938 domain-containing protein n=1 Tax=Thalassotalea insulae TaxID=2056778 RepID=A0ABQ6GMW2_9GAMM|nr:DUF2938 domain-containing protein [Thalassotalea insulae]GLX77333.1 hypothetical protein tinsulaeT_06730 [Thalassotalea insulae]